MESDIKFVYLLYVVRYSQYSYDNTEDVLVGVFLTEENANMAKRIYEDVTYIQKAPFDSPFN